jgi:hypothetical protein
MGALVLQCPILLLHCAIHHPHLLWKKLIYVGSNRSEVNGKHGIVKLQLRTNLGFMSVMTALLLCSGDFWTAMNKVSRMETEVWWFNTKKLVLGMGFLQVCDVSVWSTSIVCTETNLRRHGHSIGCMSEWTYWCGGLISRFSLFFLPLHSLSHSFLHSSVFWEWEMMRLQRHQWIFLLLSLILKTLFWFVLLFVSHAFVQNSVLRPNFQF